MNLRIITSLIIMMQFVPAARLNAQEVTPVKVDSIVNILCNQLTDHYPFPDISKKYAKMLRDNKKNYKNMDADALAERLTKDLQDVHKDVHLHIYKEDNASVISAIANMSEEEKLQKNNYGFKSVELDNKTSTAYISIPYGFNCTQAGFEMAGYAMSMAAYSKYIIIDIRGNGGGAGGMGHFLASYFFEPGQEIFYLDGFEKIKRNLQEYTYGYVPGKRLTKSKLFILTDGGTASASEGFAFAMQKLKKATIVGSTTAGAGIAVIVTSIGGGLGIFLPVKMLVAPGTQEGWEGIGVIPDIKTEDKDALSITRKLILQDLLNNLPAASVEREAIQWTTDDDILSLSEDLTKADTSVLGQYDGFQITLGRESMVMTWDNDKKTSALRKIKNDVYTIIDLNKQLGPYSSRVYINRNEKNEIISLTLKVLMDNTDIRVFKDAYKKLN